MQIIIDFDHKKLQHGFVNIAKAQQIATARTLNTMAFLSRKNAIKTIENKFILRNNYVKNNIRVDKANETWSPENQFSRLYATDKIDFMLLHEDGGIKKPKRGSSLSIGQLPARGGSKKRVINKNLYLKKIQKQIVKYPSGKGSMSSRTVAMAYVAYKTNKFIMYKKNIYQVSSFTKSKNRIHFNKIHIYSLSQRQAKIKRNPWMYPSIQKPIQDGQSIYNSQINKLLRMKEII